MPVLYSFPANRRNVLIALMMGAHVSSTIKEATASGNEHIYAYQKKDGANRYHGRGRDEELAGYMSDLEDGDDKHLCYSTKDVSDLIDEVKWVEVPDSEESILTKFKIGTRSVVICGDGDVIIKDSHGWFKKHDIRHMHDTFNKWLKEGGAKSGVWMIPVPQNDDGGINRLIRQRIGRICLLAGARVSDGEKEFKQGLGVEIRDGVVGFAHTNAGQFYTDHILTRPMGTNQPVRYFGFPALGSHFYVNKDVSEFIPECKKVVAEGNFAIESNHFQFTSDGDVVNVTGRHPERDRNFTITKKDMEGFVKFLAAYIAKYNP